MRGLQVKKKYENQSSDYQVGILNLKAPSSTRISASENLTKMSCCFGLRSSLMQKIKKLETAHNSMRSRLNNCVEKLEAQIYNKQFQNRRLRTQIGELSHIIFDMESDIEAIHNFSFKKSKKNEKKSSILKSSGLNQGKAFLFSQGQKTSEKYLKLEKSSLRF